VKPRIYFQTLNEVENFGNWTGVYENGDSTINQSENASFLYRGQYGLRLTCVQNLEYAYVYKTGLNVSILPGESVYICFTQRFTDAPSDTALTFLAVNGNSKTILYYKILTDGNSQFLYRKDDDSLGWGTGIKVLTGDWYWLGFEMQRATTSTASDGAVRLYIDGILDIEKTGLDNYDMFATLNKIEIGGIYNTPPGFVADFDEVVVADKMIRPPLPAGKVWK